MTTTTTRCDQAASTKVLDRALARKGTWDMTREELARVWADNQGVHAHTHGGGWLYTHAERPYVQGWSQLADNLERWGVIKVGTGIVWSKGPKLRPRG